MVLIVLNIKLANTCYITNCPWGGKRSSENSYLGFDVPRQCRKCASGLGTCFGPRICCGPELGCLIDTKETSVCKHEDVKSQVPCTTYGKQCDKVEFGRCATSNLCCNPEHCLEDLKCSQDDDLSSDNLDSLDQEDLNQELDKKIAKALKILIEKQKKRQEKSSSLSSNSQKQLNFENDK